ncbi:MAG TPA: biopolymer transporter ExbD [Anaeromyxobacteraceae bacterium]|nr:biopolymer transporter ExbD [Anaeromyxobacteraceae bacterium]
MAIGGPNGGEAEDLEGGGIFSDINITPLTDIFLVLLIIFMVTSTVIVEQAGQSGGLKVNLPRAGKTSGMTELHDLAIAVLEDGRTVVGGKVVDDEELGRLLDKAHGQNPDTLVLLQADQEVTHGRVVQVMEAARRHGLVRMAIATRDDGRR